MQSHLISSAKLKTKETLIFGGAQGSGRCRLQLSFQ